MNGTSSRIAWIDWMKTIAIFFIIAGHLWVPGNKYIYVFSVPCFFILSGFLSKRESDYRLFWIKIWWNLIVPMALLFLINIAVQFFLQIAKGTFDINYLWQAPLLALCGMQGQDYAAGGLKALWFVYTLIVCKVILQFVPEKPQIIILLFLNVVFLLGAMLLKRHGIVLRNSIVDVLLAMPFFTIGYLIRPLKEHLNRCSLRGLLVILIVGCFGVWLCGTYNDIVMLYRCDYGSNLFFCILGGICGTSAVFSIAKLLKSLFLGFAKVIGGGTIVILGLHFVVIQIVSQFLHLSGVGRLIEAIAILLLFWPVILFVKNKMPILYGIKRIN